MFNDEYITYNSIEDLVWSVIESSGVEGAEAKSILRYYIQKLGQPNSWDKRKLARFFVGQKTDVNMNDFEFLPNGSVKIKREW